MKDAILDALSRARAGYSELRLRRVWSSTVLMRNHTVETAMMASETGGLARCCSSGSGWGAAGFTEPHHLDSHLLRAHELSLATGSGSGGGVRLAEIPIRQYESAETPADDPRHLSLSTKRERVGELAATLLDADRRIETVRVLARDEVIETWLGTSEGTWLHHLRSRLNLSVLAIGRQEGGVERALGSSQKAGWAALDGREEFLGELAARVLERLEAAPVRPGHYPVVLDSAAAGVLFHRAVAHLARPALPGADPDVLPLGSRVGPDVLTVGDDPMAPALAAAGPYDDEGTETRRTVLIQNGVVLGHLHSRETAGAMGYPPTGHAWAGSLQGEPFPRATNTFVAPGQGSLEDLLEGIPVGVYLSDALACEHSEAGLLLRPGTARMIRNGLLSEPVKGVSLSGELLELLDKVEAVGGDFRWETGGSRCRDGAAGLVPVTSGAPQVRFGNLAIGCELT